MGSIIVGGILIVLVAAAVVAVVRGRQNGGGCCGDCSHCRLHQTCQQEGDPPAQEGNAKKPH